MPKGANLALLQAIPTEHYLQALEKHNFNVFAPKLNKPAPLAVSLKMMKATLTGRFTNSL